MKRATSPAGTLTGEQLRAAFERHYSTLLRLCFLLTEHRESVHETDSPGDCLTGLDEDCRRGLLVLRDNRSVSSLYFDSVGEGPPAIFVHGSFGWGVETFPEQAALADEYRVIRVDRRGFGRSAPAASTGWPTDMHDVAALLDELGAAHLVGQSYGAVVALLAVGLRPDRVLSLVAIEPPAFELARGHPAAEATIAALKPVYERAPTLSAVEFLSEWARAQGMTDERLAAWTSTFGEADWASVENSRQEAWPGDAPIPIDALARAAFPKVLVRGAWKPEVVGGEGRGGDLAAVCYMLAERIGARVVVFENSAHNPQIEESEAFNRLLLDLWAEVTAGA